MPTVPVEKGATPEVIKRSTLETEEGRHVFRGKDVEEISELKREGLSIRAISRLTGYGRKTISKHLLSPTGRPVYGPRSAAVSKLEPFKPYLKERLQAGVWNVQVLLRELRERNYGGGYPPVSRARSQVCPRRFIGIGFGRLPNSVAHAESAETDARRFPRLGPERSRERRKSC
jgi:hypothetical protein